MTSNVGAKNITDRRSSLGFDYSEKSSDETRSYEEIRDLVMTDLRRTFRPEFLNRIDEVIVFHQLKREHIRKIADNMVQNVAKRVADLGITLTANEEALDKLAEQGFDPVYGARPLRRTIQAIIEDGVAEMMLDGRLKKAIRSRQEFRRQDCSRKIDLIR